LARFKHTDPKTVSAITFNVLSPSLIFYTLVTAKISMSDFRQMAVFTFAVIGAAGAISWVAARAMRLDRPETSAFLVVSMFGNAGNYGLPLVLFAFGVQAMTRATVYLVMHVILLYSIGVALASGGNGGVRQALRSVVRVPHLYAIALAALVVLTNTTVPEALLRPVGLLSSATVPIMVLLMGMQLERTALPERRLPVGVATTIRLVVMPFVAFGAAALLGMTGADRQAAVIQASMPAAVMVSVLAIEYQTAPEFATAVVFLSTVLSPITLTLLISALQH